MQSLKHILAACAVALALGCPTDATADTVLLGDQDFADGAVVNLSFTFAPAQVGEPAPIGLSFGNDNSANGAGSFTFAYGAGQVSSGVLTFGIYDHDSAAPGHQVVSFDVDGVDLTAALDALFETHGGAQTEVNVYTLVLDGAALAALQDGTATFSLALQGPSNGGLPFNGYLLDFARLDLRVAAVPEPGTHALLLAGLAVLGVLARRRVGSDPARA